MSPPELIFGGASIGHKFVTKEDVQNLVEVLKKVGISRFDTAGRYPALAMGMSEKLLGEVKAVDQGFKIDTKIFVGATKPEHLGSLTSLAIEKSLSASLLALQVTKVNVLYAHTPDLRTPLEEQAAAFDDHYKLGKFEYLGLSNFTPKLIEKWIEISSEKGYVKPTFFEGQYNLFCRGYEEALFPVLRKHGIHFMAFCPLAAGFLTGKLTPTSKPEDLVGTRFEVGTFHAQAAKHWFDKPGMHKGIELLGELSQKSGIPMDELALRWIVYHSCLKEGDGVILGASRISQVEGNTLAISQGPLEEEIVKELDALWEVVKEDAKGLV